MSGWIKCEDQLPELIDNEGSKEVLLAYYSKLWRGIIVGSLIRDSEGELYWDCGDGDYSHWPMDAITHWQPLPALPVMEET